MHLHSLHPEAHLKALISSSLLFYPIQQSAPATLSFTSNANVSGHIGVRLRTHRRIRRDSPLQGRNTQSTKRSFVRWVYFALRGLALA